MTLIKAIDFSRWQGDVTYDTMKDMVDNHGIKMFILQGYGGGPGMLPNPNLEKHLGYAISLGCYVAIYSLPSTMVAEAISAAGQYKDDLEFVALDVEGGYGVTHDDVAYILEQGLAPWLYTSEGAWAADGSGDFPSLSLWDARYYNNTYSVDFPPTSMEPAGYYKEYGGWTQRDAWQYNGDVSVAGLRVDVSLVDEEFLMNENKVRSIAHEEAQKSIGAYNVEHHQEDHKYLAWAKDVGSKPKLLSQVKVFLNRLARGFVPIYRKPLLPASTFGTDDTVDTDDK